MLQPTQPHRLWESLAQIPETKSHPTKCSARGCCPALPLSPKENKTRLLVAQTVKAHVR